MASDVNDASGDLEQLRRRFEEFRSSQQGRVRLPEILWAAAAELAKRHGVNPTARALQLDFTGLRKRVENSPVPKQKPTTAAPTFMEFVAPGAKPVTNCTMEVESAQGGKMRLELKALATSELVDLIRAFVSR
jgi:hypothetical protein